MGTYLYARGISFEHNFDELNLSQPKVVGAVHRAYLAAGADLVETNTFGANRMRLAAFGLEDKVRLIARQGARIARDAREVVGVPAFVAGSMGPLGRPLAPYGTVAADEAEGLFREAAEGLLEGGVDLFVLETFGDLGEILVALRAIQSLCTLPVMALMTFAEDGRSIVGHLPADCYAALAERRGRRRRRELLGRAAGARSTSCRRWSPPARRAPPARRGRALAAMPNAGLPQMVAGRYVYVATPEYFGAYARRFVEAGAERRRRLLRHDARARGAHARSTCRPSRPIRRRCIAPRLEAIAAPAEAGETGARRRRRPSPRSSAKLRQRFYVSVELDPPRGINPQKILAGAGLLAEHGVDAINVADSPMARVRMSAQALTYLVMRHYPQFDPILHFTCRDRNLMGIQADLLGAHAMGITTILALTGDPPSTGDYPNVTAVYDVDSVGLIRIIKKLNAGTDLAGNPIGERTRFAIACAVNPTADDLDLELTRFREKVDAGRRFRDDPAVLRHGGVGRVPGALRAGADPGAARHPAAAVVPPRRVHAQRGAGDHGAAGAARPAARRGRRRAGRGRAPRPRGCSRRRAGDSRACT